MNTIKISKLLFSTLFLWGTMANAQHLTISNSGETTSPGTNWSIIGNVLYIGNSGSASINTSVITNHLQNTGDLTINLPEQSNVARNIYINNTIAYLGSSARTLTFQSGNDIVFANTVGITSATASLNIVLRSATTTGTPDNGSVKMDGINIDTKGGHLWVGGGATATTWNGLSVGNSIARTYLDDVAGISVVGSTIASGGGNIYMYGLSWNSSDDDGVNYGINVENSTVSSGSGAIYFKADINGRYTNGIGMRVIGTTSITSTSGAISIFGYGYDGATNGNSWRHAASIQGSAQIKSVSGNITVGGDAAFTATVNDKEGLMITDGAAICSQSGNISLRGTNTLESSGQYSNSIRFAAANLANSIRIGYDGTNAYSGNITIEGNSIYQRATQAGAGSIAVQTTGTLTIQPTGNAFTYMRAGDAGSLTFDDDWNFGTNLGGFVYGKTTNTTALTYSNALTTNGPITMYAGTLTQNGAVSSGGAITFNCSDFALGNGINLSTSTASDITINANGYFDTSGSTRRTISSANGNIIIHADKDANGSGMISIDYLTLNPGTGATIIRGETVSFLVGSINGPYINGTGSFTFQSSDASFGQTINTSWFEIDQDNNGIGGLTIGKAGSIADIIQNRAISTAGHVNMYGNNITFSSALTATNSDVSLYANTAVTQTSPIIAAGLSLNGIGTFTLTNSSNNFTTVAGGAVGSLLGATQIIDVSGGLTIGTVGSTTGLTGSSTIRVETLAGDLTLAGNISTSSTSTDAVILTAAKSTAIGVPTGGDILVSGNPSITMGTGGIAKLFSGYDVTSTGLTALAGASNVRINYDETTTTFNPVLSANNKYAIYRTALGYGDLNIVSSGGDAEGTTWTYANGVITTTSGTANVLNTVIETKLNSGNLSIEANKVTFSTNVTGTTNNALSILSKTHIVNTNATTITTQGGNVLFASNVDDATDGESTTNGYIQLRQGITVNSNGGDITFGGGNILGSDYSLGSSTEDYTEGVRFDTTIALNSGGGNITLRGKSYARGVQLGYGASGIGFYYFSAATGTINSGTGTITIDGYSQTNTSTYAAGFYCMHNLTITSTNTTSNAINITGKATGASGEAWGIESESTLSVLATGTGGGITINTSKQLTDNFDAVFRGETNILAVSGPINLKTGQLSGTTNGYLYLNGHMYLGSKAGSAVTSSSSNINIQVDRYYYENFALPKLATSGSVTIQPNATSFGTNTYTSYFNFNQNGQTMTDFTFGKPGNAGNLYLNTAFTVAGPINAYGGYVEVSNTITSSATGNILLKGIVNSGSCVNISGGITKSSGTGTLTMQGHGRVNNTGTITTSGTGVLNVIMWSDYDGDNVGGGSTLGAGGSISTNGGHIWMGGSNSNGGSYSWNGLAVGDGPSTGAASANCNAIDLFGPITTAGGDVLLWASNNGGCGLSGIQSDGTRLINASSGDITLIAYQTGGAIELTSTGVISLLPHAGSYTSALTLGGTLTTGNFTFNTSFYNGLKINSLSSVGGLTIGKYTELLNSGTAVNIGNTSNITFSSAATIAGPIIVYGGTIALEANLTTTNNGDISLYTDAAIGGLTAARTITAAGSFNYIPRSDLFSAPVTYPITNLNLTSTGLLIGKPTNTANITFANTTTVAGPITAYGGTITLNANLTTTNSGNISLYTDNPLEGLSTARTLSAAGAFKYIPRVTAFTAAVTYPIANLSATCSGLTIGNLTNDKDITINSNVEGGAGIELYGNNLAINSNLKTTSSADMYLKGNTTIASEKYIESNGNFTHDGNLIFKSDAMGTAAFGALGGTFTTVSGLATTERYIPAKRAWRLLNAPLKGATNTTVTENWQGVNGEGLLLFSPATYQSQTMTGYTLGGGMPNIWKYNNGWQAIPNLTNENLFTTTGTNGFLVFATGTSDSNTIVLGETATTLKPQGQLITGEVVNSIIGNQYNLVPNPYASALNTETMVQANAGSKVWMVDPSLGNFGGYTTYDGTNWAPTTPTVSDKNIQSGQAFFVRTASNSTFSITESHKISGSSNTWFSRTAGTSSDKIRVLLYKEKNSEWQLADGILAVNSASGNNEVDNTDTGKMSNFNENLLFRNGTSNLAIEYRGLPTAGTTQPMRLTGTTVQPYQLKVKAESYTNTNLQPYIQDTQLGTVTAIPTDGSEIVLPFTGVAASSTNPDSRFIIIYLSTLSTNNPDVLSVGVYPNPVNTGVFTVSLKENTTPANYSLTNLLGQQVQVGKLMSLNNSVNVTSLQIGIYILQVEQEGKTFSTKLIIK
nr:T9SS type A sorting domain-containing protein [uncultured Flavobacterium sp.]